MTNMEEKLAHINKQTADTIHITATDKKLVLIEKPHQAIIYMTNMEEKRVH